MAKKDSVKVKALGSIDHDGARYEAGDVIELNSEQAQTLIDLGAACAPSEFDQAIEKAATPVEVE